MNSNSDALTMTADHVGAILCVLDAIHMAGTPEEVKAYNDGRAAGLGVCVQIMAEESAKLTKGEPDSFIPVLKKIIKELGA